MKSAYLMQSDNKWYPAPAHVEAASIPAFRCFLLQKGGANARALTTELVDDLTGVETIRTIDADGNENVYDLSGRPMTTTAKGIFISNGKKGIIK